MQKDIIYSVLFRLAAIKISATIAATLLCVGRCFAVCFSQEVEYRKNEKNRRESYFLLAAVELFCLYDYLIHRVRWEL